MSPPCEVPDAVMVESVFSVIDPAVIAMLPPAPSVLLASITPLRLARFATDKLIEPPSPYVVLASRVPPSARLDALRSIVPPPVASMVASRSMRTALSADRIIRPFWAIAERA